MGRQWQGQERRRFKRAVLSADARIKITAVPDGPPPEEGPPPEGGDSPAEEQTAKILNIGEGGLAFLSANEMAADTQLEATFSFVFHGRKERLFTVGCRVCYCLLRGDYKTYQTGCEFTRIGEADKKLISDYVAAAWAARRSEPEETA